MKKVLNCKSLCSNKKLVKKLTLSVIKADIASIAGHICPSDRLLELLCEDVGRSPNHRVFMEP